MQLLRVGSLPDTALEAAARFHELLPGLLNPPPVGEDIVLVFPPASHEHTAWRLAAVQDLARTAVPHRVNGVVGTDEHAIAETAAFIERSPGLTGQVLALDGKFTETR